ncbi:MAG: hypothetical protein QM767_08715 [Anaeromyxobacter sp.]
MARHRSLLALAAVALLAAGAAACSGTLVDGQADPADIAPSCSAVQVICGGACFDEDPTHCGNGCADCTGRALPAGAEAVCEAHACTFACAPGTLRSGDSCQAAIAVAAGWAHTCAITADGAVHCWGDNRRGQLGDGTTDQRDAPVDVALPGPATALAAGYVHTCAAVAGEAWCWGDNSTGALGDGTTTGRTAPVKVPGLAGVTALAAGGGENAGQVSTYYGHTCALAGGLVRCWGGNESGQLGDGSFTQRLAPVAPSGLGSGATAIATGDRHTCAVVAGQAWCWGADGSSQLGDGNTQNRNTPQRPIGSGAAQVAGGAVHSCAVADGALLCWGGNDSGQSAGGDPTPGVVRTPAAVDLAGVAPAQVATGGAHSCAAGGGALRCFGGNGSGQLGVPATARGAVTVDLPAVQAVTAGYAHTCALLASGGVMCWGDGAWGQLGRGGDGGGDTSAPGYVSGR